MTTEIDPKFARHWQTQRLVDVFAALAIGERLSWVDAASKCGVEVDALRKRLQSARRVALHEHAVIIVSIPGVGFERLPQDAADLPATKYLAGARSKARRARDVIRKGVTDWERIERTKKNELFAIEAQASVVAQVTSSTTRARLAAASETANARLDFGRTMEVLAK